VIEEDTVDESSGEVSSTDRVKHSKITKYSDGSITISITTTIIVIIHRSQLQIAENVLSTQLA